MGSQALAIVTEAYRKHNLDEVTSFSTTQDFPFNLAISTINDVIRYANRMGPFYFTETKTALSYSVGVYTYDMVSLNINPRQIKFIRKEATDHWGELKAFNHRDFMERFRRAAVQTQEPTGWTRFANTLELNSIPDANYSIYCYHFRDMPTITATTDTFLVPESDEDILIESCYQILGARIGRWEMPQAEVEIRNLFTPFISDVKQDTAMPTQMPAMF